MKLGDFKSRATEFEVQATAYNLLKDKYPTVRGELKVKPTGKRGARFDLLIFGLDGNLLFTIEVKDNPSVTTHSKKRYYEYLTDAPNITIAGMEQALDVINICRKNGF